MAARDVLDVALDLGLQREPPAPAGVPRKRVRVEVTRHVAGRAGVGVLVPHAAHALAALEHGDVVDAGAPQGDRGADAAESGTDDRDRGHGFGRGKLLALNASQPRSGSTVWMPMIMRAEGVTG